MIDVVTLVVALATLLVSAVALALAKRSNTDIFCQEKWCWRPVVSIQERPIPAGMTPRWVQRRDHDHSAVP